MARTKKKEPIIVGNLNDDYIVTKSRPLMFMKEVPFELGELKVLDTYLSRINPLDPEATTVRFKKEEYEELMGIERMRPERLSKYVDSIMGKRITVPDPNKSGAWKKYNLFDYSECFKDENGQWWIDLNCTTKAKELIFNVKEIGYMRYQLKNVIPLKSKYSVLLYLYLLNYKFRGSWTEDLKELRERFLDCKLQVYEEYKYFKRDILDKSIKEVNEKTDLTFEYTAIKSGRKTTGIKFTLVKDETPPSLPEGKQEQEDVEVVADAEYKDVESIFDQERQEREEKYAKFKDENNTFFADYLPAHFTEDEVIVLRDIAFEHVPYNPHDVIPRECRVVDYLRAKYNLMKTQRKPVAEKNQFSWLRKACDEDWK